MYRILDQILMAEDSADDAELTLGALAQNNFANNVAVVYDGAEALDYLYRRGLFTGRDGPSPILLLLDLKMPKVNGLEVLRQIKTSPELASIPVVILSSSCQEVELQEAQKLGADAYVLKPVRFKDFVEAIKIIGKFWGGLNVLRPIATAQGG